MDAGYGRLSVGYSVLQPWLNGSEGGQVASQILSPAPSSVLAGSTATFSWSASPDALEYQLYVGTAPGTSNLFSRNMGALTQVTVAGLPTNGSIVYVRLSTHLLLGWYYRDYTYTAPNSLTSPTPSITALFPASVPAMSPDTNLIISGTNFVSGASATWTFNGVSTGLNTQFVSATTLNAIIPAALLTTPGVAAVTVANPTGSPSKIATLAISTPVGPVYTYSTSIPHFGAGGSFVSILYVLNNSNSNAQFQITFLDDAGRQIFVPVAGVGAVAQFGDSVPANGLKYYELGNGARSLSSGSVLINSTGALTVQEVFRNHAPDNTYYEAGIQSTAGSRGFEVPFDATIFPGTNAQIFTGIAIANLDPTNVATVSCTARDSNGFIIPNAVSVPQLGPLGHWANYLFPALNGRRGMLDCSSNTTIAPVGLRFLGANAFSTLPIILK